MDGKALKALIELSMTPKEADEELSKFTNFETTKEKIAYLKGMFYELNLEITDQEKSDSDEDSYQYYLEAIVSHKFK